MVKVLFYTRDFFAGGAEKVLLEYLKAIDKEKFEITLMVRRRSGGFKEQFEALQDRGVRIKKCFEDIKNGKNIFQRIKNTLTFRISDFCEFRFPSIFYRLAIREKYDVEIAFMHNEAAAIIASSSNRRSKKFLWIHTDLSKISTYKQYFRSRKRQKRLFEKFDHCICVSNVVANALDDLLKISENVKVIYNPIDHMRITSLSQEFLPYADINVPTVCAVGRLSWEKNFALLIRAHSKLIQRGVLHNLCIVGDGPEKEALQILIKELGVENTVTLTGFKENPYPYIRNADFLVCSSVYEGLPVATQEAIVLEKPVVSCCKVVQETFGEHNCGIITDSTEEALSAGIEKMLTDESLYKKCLHGAKMRSAEYKEHFPHKTIEYMMEE